MMYWLCFSRARYTLPNLPRPSGLPTSKSCSVHRFSVRGSGADGAGVAAGGSAARSGAGASGALAALGVGAAALVAPSGARGAAGA